MENHSEYPKQFELNDGTMILLRPMRCDDQDRLRLFFRQLSQGNRRYFKRDAVLDEVIGKWCQQLDYDRVLPVLAIAGNGDNERVLADGTLHTESHGRSVHVARIRWVVSDDMLEQGLERILVRELLRQAHKRGIQKVQANLLVKDRQSILLLQRLCFREEAIFTRHAVDLRGSMHDVVVLSREIKHETSAA